MQSELRVASCESELRAGPTYEEYLARVNGPREEMPAFTVEELVAAEGGWDYGDRHVNYVFREVERVPGAATLEVDGRMFEMVREFEVRR